MNVNHLIRQKLWIIICQQITQFQIIQLIPGINIYLYKSVIQIFITIDINNMYNVPI